MEPIKYYLVISGQKKGPFTEDEIQTQLADKEISPTTYCWTEGFDKWIPLKDRPAVAQPEPHPEPEPTLPPSEPHAPIWSAAGRLNRRQWLLRKLFAMGMVYILTQCNRAWGNQITTILTALCVLAIGLFIILQDIKRWHDANKSGWFELLLCIPILGSLINNLALLAIAPKPTTNQWGPPPHKPDYRPELYAVGTIIILVCLTIWPTQHTIMQRERRINEDRAILEQTYNLVMASQKTSAQLIHQISLNKNNPNPQTLEATAKQLIAMGEQESNAVVRVNQILPLVDHDTQSWDSSAKKKAEFIYIHQMLTTKTPEMMAVAQQEIQQGQNIVKQAAKLQKNHK